MVRELVKEARKFGFQRTYEELKLETDSGFEEV